MLNIRQRHIVERYRWPGNATQQPLSVVVVRHLMVFLADGVWTLISDIKVGKCVINVYLQTNVCRRLSGCSMVLAILHDEHCRLVYRYTVGGN